MTAQPTESVLPEVKVLRLQPGDVLVAKLDEGARPETLDEIRRKLTERFPGHEVLLCIGLDLQIARQSDGDVSR